MSSILREQFAGWTYHYVQFQGLVTVDICSLILFLWGLTWPYTFLGLQIELSSVISNRLASETPTQWEGTSHLWPLSHRELEPHTFQIPSFSWRFSGDSHIKFSWQPLKISWVAHSNSCHGYSIPLNLIAPFAPCSLQLFCQGLHMVAGGLLLSYNSCSTRATLSLLELPVLLLLPSTAGNSCGAGESSSFLVKETE